MSSSRVIVATVVVTAGVAAATLVAITFATIVALRHVGSTGINNFPNLLLPVRISPVLRETLIKAVLLEICEARLVEVKTECAHYSA